MSLETKLKQALHPVKLSADQKKGIKQMANEKTQAHYFIRQSTHQRIIQAAAQINVRPSLLLDLLFADEQVISAALTRHVNNMQAVLKKTQPTQ